MAGFKTHITTSSLLGVAYGAVGFLKYDVPGPTCLLAAGLCGVSGMLPDIDSDSVVPLRESLAFGSAVVPVMLADRLQRLAMSPSTIILVGAATYLGIRFGLGHVLKKYTVHRGMFHSLPAAGIFGLLTYLLAPGAATGVRWFQAAAVVVGFMSHLILDEMWSLGLNTGKLQVKKSFGTALKLWGPSPWANVSAYGKLALLAFTTLREPNFMQNVENGQLGSALNEMVQGSQLGGQAGPGGLRASRNSPLQGVTGQVVRNVLNSLTSNQVATPGPAAAPPVGDNAASGPPTAAPVYVIPQSNSFSTPPSTGSFVTAPAVGSYHPPQYAGSYAPPPSSRSFGSAPSGSRWPRSDIRIAPPATAAPQDYSWSPPGGNTPPPSAAQSGSAWSPSVPAPSSPSWSIGGSGGASGNRIPPPALGSAPRW